MLINAHTKIVPCACTDLVIPKAEKVEQKEQLKIRLMWGKFFFDVFLDGEIFIYLEKKR